MAPTPDPLDRVEDTFFVESLVGAETKQPLVKLTMRSVSVTVTAEEARQVALKILDGVAAAEYDAVTYRVCMAKMGMSPRETGRMMTMMRTARDELAAEKK